tara:strand:- start:2072 stop:2344 length:273 start_codon:yes stop_codon:yes gene_type:complete
MNAWEVSKRLSHNLPVTSDQLSNLKKILNVDPSRRIRYADRSETEDLIIFEIEVIEERKGRYIVSIASDTTTESDFVPWSETMDVHTSWM